MYPRDPIFSWWIVNPDRSILSVAFAREWEPATVLMFAAPERLVNERFVEDNEDMNRKILGKFKATAHPGVETEDVNWKS